MHYEEQNNKIKQLIPVPECLTPLEYLSHDNIFMDTSGTVFLALMEKQEENEETMFYTIDAFGSGCFIYWYEIILVKTVYCKRCGQRMKIEDIPYENYHGGIISLNLTYTCPCGMKYHTRFADPSCVSEWEE